MSRHLLAVLAAVALVWSCSNPATPKEGELYVSQKAAEERLLLKPDGTFSLKTPAGESKGTYTREAEAIVILGENHVRTKLSMQGSDLVDGGGITWAKR